MRKTELRFVQATDEKGAESIEKRKAKLRQYMKGRRADNENRDVKELLMNENLYKVIFEGLKGAGTRLNFFVYLSYSSEAPTDKLVEGLKQRGQAVYCPRIENGEMYPVLCGEDFSLSAYGIREPIGETFLGEMDIAIIPLLGVDERGNRLGYGGGYYDRFLRERPKMKRIAFCYDFQVLKDVPHTQTDEKMDVIVTDRQIIYLERDSER